MGSAQDTAVVIPAKDEGERVASTVIAAHTLEGVDLVIVVDDGSSDDTAAAARTAGAHVIRHSRNRGKSAAMESGAEAVRLIEAQRSRKNPRNLLFLDADLGDTAKHANPLIAPIRAGEADMSIAVFPTTRLRRGGHGLVLRLAREGIRRATSWALEQPLNGQRCLTREAFEAALPLASGFGVETGLTIDLLHKKYRITEVEVPLEHRATGTDLASQIHRAHQFYDVLRALRGRARVKRVIRTSVE